MFVCVGPFKNAEMTEWFTAGYFTMSLQVRRGPDAAFVSLGQCSVSLCLSVCLSVCHKFLDVCVALMQPLSHWVSALCPSVCLSVCHKFLDVCVALMQPLSHWVSALCPSVCLSVCYKSLDVCLSVTST